MKSKDTSAAGSKGGAALRRVMPLALVAALAVGTNSLAATSAGATTKAARKEAATSSCMRHAKAAVAAAEKPVNLQTGSPFPATKLKGKTFAFVADDMALGIDSTTYQGFKAAAASVGASTSSFDGQGQVPDYIAAMNEALAQHPAGIVFDAIGPNYIGQQLAQAKSEGIPTVGLLEPASSAESSYLNPNDAALGRTMADFVLEQTGCKANVAMFDAPSFGTMVTETKGAQKEIGKRCPSCSFAIVNQNIADIGTTTGPATSTEIERHPNLNYLMSAFDAMSTEMVPAVQSSGKKLPLVGSWSQPNTLQFVAKGAVEKATLNIGDDAPDGWGAFDQVGRLALKLPAAAAVSNIPYQLVDSKDVASASKLPGYKGYQAKYKKTFEA